MQNTTEANEGNQGTGVAAKKPVVHLMIWNTHETIIARNGVEIRLGILPAARVEMLVSCAARLLIGIEAPWMKQSLAIWTDADSPAQEWLRIDEHAPHHLSASQATDLLMIADRALRLAGAAAEESQVSAVPSPKSEGVVS